MASASAKKAAPAKKAATTKKVAPVKKAAVKAPAPAKKPPVKAAPTAKPAVAKKATTSKSAAPARKAPAKAPVKASPKPAVKAAPTPVAKKAAPAKTVPVKAVPAKAVPVKAVAVKTVPAKATSTTATKAPNGKAPAKKPASVKGKLVVREDESPWTAAEIAAVRKELEADVERLLKEIAATEADIADLVSDSGDGAGDDQADAGSKTFEREHEMSLANNARDMLMQTEHALHRIDNKTYGICESCGRPVGKLRLQAFPRATMCLSCKQIDERRAL